MEKVHAKTPGRKAFRLACNFALAIFCVVSSAVVVAQMQAGDVPKFHINSDRLQGTLEKLSEFGRNAEGGVTRIGFSETDMAAG